jgi:hypothetical protein
MNPIQRLARNSAAPIAAQLINKVVDLGFTLRRAAVAWRYGNGEYAFAVTVWLYAKPSPITASVSSPRAMSPKTVRWRMSIWG